MRALIHATSGPGLNAKSEQGVAGAGRARKVTVATVASTPVIIRTCTQRAAWGYSATQCPGQQVTVREGPCGPCVQERTLRPLLSEQLSEAPFQRCPHGPHSPRSGGFTLHLCQAWLDPNRSLLLDLDLRPLCFLGASLSVSRWVLSTSHAPPTTTHMLAA